MPPGCNTVPTAVVHVPRVARFPYTLSVRDVIVTGSGPLLITWTLKVKSPPGTGRVAGVASLMTRIWGRTLVMATVALSDAWAVSPLWSTAVAVTVSVWVAPGGPVNGAVKVQV